MTPTEHGPIVTAARDYIDGWYTGDAARMERSLHPALAKRIQADNGTGTLTVADMSARELIDLTAAGTGTADPTRRDDVRVLDVFGRAASVRIDATGWVDYLHLIQTASGWKIINVLWERRQPTSDPGQSATTPGRSVAGSAAATANH